MADVHNYLRRVISEDGEFDWVHIMAAIHEIEGEDPPTPETVELMRDLAKFDGEIRLGGRSGAVPHALSPTDMIRSHAVQALARWDRDEHRDHIQDVADTAGSYQLKAITDSVLED
jgi:hypothetical protein